METTKITELPIEFIALQAEIETDKETALEFSKAIIKMAKDIFNSEGQVSPMFGILTSHIPSAMEMISLGEHPSSQIPDRMGVLMIRPISFIDAYNKNMSAEIVKSIANKTQACGVIFVSESWVVVSKLPGIPGWTGSLEHHPDRKEVVQVMFEHKLIGTKIWQAEIERDAENKGTLGEFVEFAASVSGRFTNFIEVPNRLAN